MLRYDDQAHVIKAEAVANPLAAQYSCLGRLYFERIKQWAALKLPSQIDGTTGERSTYDVLLVQAIRVALKLRQIGVKPGDVVSMCSYNHLHTLVPYVAIQFLGAVIASTDPTIPHNDHVHLLNEVRPKAIFVSENAEELIQNAFNELNLDCKIIVFGRTKKSNLNFDTFLVEQDGERDFQPYDVPSRKATAKIIFSSGSTGMPKGICHNHDFFMHNAAILYAINDKMKSMTSFTSLYWVSSNMFYATSLIYGLFYVSFHSLDVATVWRDVERYNIDFCFLSSYYAVDSIKYIPSSGAPKLSVLFLGGSAIAKENVKMLRDRLPKSDVVVGYGQTEVGIATLTRRQYYDNTACVGQPTPGMHMKVVDIGTGAALGCNQKGEICTKSNNILTGYYNNVANSDFDADGFLKSGDIGYYDDTYNFYIVDRLKQIFKYKSWPVSPINIEIVLESHPDVQMAGVVGVPHPRDDNHAWAFVMRSDGATVSERELVDYVAANIDARHHLTGGVRFVDALPLTVSGKLKRDALKRLVTELGI